MSELSVPVTEHDHLKGAPNAPCSLVEYGDFQCPSCAAVEPILRSLQSHFGDQMSLVFRNFPLREIHPWAERAAELAEFAGCHGKFWEMHDLLFANQQRFDDHTFHALAAKLGLAGSELELGRSREDARKRIDRDFAGGIRSGVNGTPAFFLNGDRYDGPTDYESLVALMEQVLISNGD